MAYVLTLECGFDDVVGYALAVEYGELCSGRGKKKKTMGEEIVSL